MHIDIFGERKARLTQGWTKETLVGLFSDSELDASAAPGPGATLTVIGLFSDTVVRVPPGTSVEPGGVSVFGEQKVEVVPGDGAPIRLKSYGLFCDTKVVEAR